MTFTLLELLIITIISIFIIVIAGVIFGTPSILLAIVSLSVFYWMVSVRNRQRKSE